VAPEDVEAAEGDESFEHANSTQAATMGATRDRTRLGISPT
jgi:hypothetical protein